MTRLDYQLSRERKVYQLLRLAFAVTEHLSRYAEAIRQ
jgi:hypothetical protein